MNTIRPLWLLLIVIATAAVGWLAAVLTTGAGLTSPVLGLTSIITLAAVSLLVLVLGIRVHRTKKKPPAARMDPLAAARTLVLGQASAYAGALIAGWHVGVLGHLAVSGAMGSRRSEEALLLIIAGLVQVIIGFIVEQMCRIPPADGTGGGPDAPAGGPRDEEDADAPERGPRPGSGPAYGRQRL